jgi:hypothetical protein
VGEEVNNHIIVKMDRASFKSLIREKNPEELVKNYLWSEKVTAFSNSDSYLNFKTAVKAHIDGIEHISLVGTGNWKYSLNPRKNFKPFNETSDIDVAVISSQQFITTWDEMRLYHRNHWYKLSYEQRIKLRRNCENIYSGFISPSWIPEKRSKIRFQHKRLLNTLSDERVNFLPVKMLFFKNSIEAIDYYKRGFILAQRKVNQDEI